jgi:hypothetical protein
MLQQVVCYQAYRHSSVDDTLSSTSEDDIIRLLNSRRDLSMLRTKYTVRLSRPSLLAQAIKRNANLLYFLNYSCSTPSTDDDRVVPTIIDSIAKIRTARRIWCFIALNIAFQRANLGAAFTDLLPTIWNAWHGQNRPMSDQWKLPNILQSKFVKHQLPIAYTLSKKRPRLSDLTN